MIDIKFKKLNDKTILPKLAYSSDAGADVIAMSKTWLKDLDCWEYGLGFSTEIPIGYKGVIVPRSSISKYDLIMCNSPAQIDKTYTGEWKVRFKVINSRIFTEANKTYEVGDKIAQMFFEPVLQFNFIETETLTQTERNSGGFGSTDTKK